MTLKMVLKGSHPRGQGTFLQETVRGALEGKVLRGRPGAHGRA